jgi:predicted nucleic acid-binding protein
MPLTPILVDTWALLALANVEDQWHGAAEQVSEQLERRGCPLVVTEWILAEFLGSAARPPVRRSAVAIVDQLRRSSLTEIIPATHDEWERGFEVYRARPDKSWSLVDCISILLCRRQGIEDVFTGDQHFEQAGLRILVRSRKRK